MKTPFFKYVLIHLRIITLLSFLLNTLGPVPVAQAQEIRLPVPGVMVHLSPPEAPPVLKGVIVYPNNPFKFDFILDRGESGLSNDQLKEESKKLVKYFLSSITTPEQDLWVNLSPYEKNRIVPESFGQTDMGRDLLAEDYILKQITASLIYPEGEIGIQFWKRVYEEASKKFGTTNIPVNTFNKVWIVPDHAKVYEHGNTAFVVKASLKVMLEEDYLSLQKHNVALPLSARNDSHSIGNNIVREIVIPQLEKEVNEGKNFAPLRQIYYSLILAVWFKKRMKDSILGRKYMDQNKDAGIHYEHSVILSAANDPKAPLASSALLQNDVEGIYQRYLKAFKKGVYNYIKEESNPVTQEMVPRKYFSGGAEMSAAMTTTDFVQTMDSTEISNLTSSDFASVAVDLDNAPTGPRARPAGQANHAMIMIPPVAILNRFAMGRKFQEKNYFGMGQHQNFSIAFYERREAGFNVIAPDFNDPKATFKVQIPWSQQYVPGDFNGLVDFIRQAIDPYINESRGIEGQFEEFLVGLQGQIDQMEAIVAEQSAPPSGNLAMNAQPKDQVMAGKMSRWQFLRSMAIVIATATTVGLPGRLEAGNGELPQDLNDQRRGAVDAIRRDHPFLFTRPSASTDRKVLIDIINRLPPLDRSFDAKDQPTQESYRILITGLLAQLVFLSSYQIQTIPEELYKKVQEQIITQASFLQDGSASDDLSFGVPMIKELGKKFWAISAHEEMHNFEKYLGQNMPLGEMFADIGGLFMLQSLMNEDAVQDVKKDMGYGQLLTETVTHLDQKMIDQLPHKADVFHLLGRQQLQNIENALGPGLNREALFSSAFEIHLELQANKAPRAVRKEFEAEQKSDTHQKCSLVKATQYLVLKYLVKTNKINPSKVASLLRNDLKNKDYLFTGENYDIHINLAPVDVLKNFIGQAEKIGQKHPNAAMKAMSVNSAMSPSQPAGMNTRSFIKTSLLAALGAGFGFLRLEAAENDQRVAAHDFEKAFLIKDADLRINTVQGLLDRVVEQNRGYVIVDLIKLDYDLIPINKVAKKYGYILFADDRGGIVAKLESPSTMKNGVSTVELVSVSKKITAQDQMIYLVLDNNTYGWFVPMSEHTGVVGFIPMSQGIIDAVPQIVEAILKSTLLEDKFKQTEEIMLKIVEGYTETVIGLNKVAKLMANFDTAKLTNANSGILKHLMPMMYMVHRINLKLKPVGYIMTEDFLIHKIQETNKDGVLFVRQVNPDGQALVTGLTTQDGQSIINLDSLQNDLNSADNTSMPGSWTDASTKFKEIAFKDLSNEQMMKNLSYIFAKHEASHRNRWRKIALKILGHEVKPDELTYDQFLNIAEANNKAHSLDEDLARLGELHTSVKEKRFNDIWASLYFLSLAGYENDHLIFALLSGQKDTEALLKNMETELSKKKPSADKLKELLLQRQFDNDQISKTWLDIANKHTSGQPQTEVLAQRINRVFHVLYDTWDILNAVQTPENDRAMTTNGYVEFMDHDQPFLAVLSRSSHANPSQQFFTIELFSGIGKEKKCIGYIDMSYDLDKKEAFLSSSHTLVNFNRTQLHYPKGVEGFNLPDGLTLEDERKYAAIYVDKEYRDRDFGSVLMRYGLDFLKGLPLNRLRILNGKDGAGFYKKFGAELIGQDAEGHFEYEIKIANHAQLTENTGPGGIDLTAQRMNLEVEKDKGMLSQPMDLKVFENIEINGLYIKDIEIKPLKNLLELLGVSSSAPR